MIEVNQHPDKSSGYWVAACEIGGTTYVARSRHGAPHELARVLVDAGVPDDVMRVYSAGLKGRSAYGSFHAAAKRTVAESSSTPGPVSVRWRDPTLELERLRKGVSFTEECE